MQHADVVAVGEAEVLWPRILDDFSRGKLRTLYREDRPGSFDLAHAPMPRYDLLDPDKYNRITVQTSRGCSHDCGFCAGSKLFGSGFRQKPVDRIVQEIERIKETWPNPFIEFADDNTFVDKAWSRELLSALLPLGIKWFAETDISVAEDDELLRLMYESGCYQLLIGLESVNEASLEGIDAHNWKLHRSANYLDAIEAIQARGIAVNGCFIVGLDGDTPAIFGEVKDFIERSRLLEAQITVLTPFPGTRLHQRLKAEGRLLSKDYWDRCTLFDINYQPKNMRVEELEAGLLWLFGEIYNEQQYVKRKRQYIDIIKKLPKRNTP
jgi:radical SAM superfamily enzyme YgiQ (UPF0313 family)